MIPDDRFVVLKKFSAGKTEGCVLRKARKNDKRLSSSNETGVIYNTVWNTVVA